MPAIAYITYSGSVKYSAANGFNEYSDTLPYLQSKGLKIKQEIWDDPDVNWSIYDTAILKTPWDYHEKFEAFKNWLNRMQAMNIRLLNDYETVRWNMDKHYLKEIQDAGFEVIPSLFLEQGWHGELAPLYEQLHTTTIIIKPCVSGGSKNTIVIDVADAHKNYERVLALLQKGDFIVQPLMKEVQEGECSYIFFNGKYSHSILKKPKAGDFRVQQIYGGTIETLLPSLTEQALAQSYVDTFAKNALYARVDGLMVNGRFMLMELELIEPFLYLSYGDNAIENYYQALVAQLEK